MLVTTTPTRSRATLTGISSRAWEHPADRGALVALRKLKGFDTVLKAINALFNERANRLLFLGAMVRVDERQFAGLHRLLGRGGPDARRRRAARDVRAPTARSPTR